LAVYLVAAAVGVSALVILGRRVWGELGLVTWRQSPLALLRGEYARIARFLAATNGNSLFKLLQRNADILLIGYWLNPAAAGYLRLARSMTDLMGFPVGPVYTASYPEFARLWHQGELSALRRLVRNLTLSSTSVALAALAVIWLGGGWLLQLVVGKQYLPALPVLRWLALGTAIAVATNFGHPFLLAIGRASSSLLAIALGVVSQLVLLAFLLPVMGVAAAGAAYLGHYLVWVVVVAAASRSVWLSRA
jgi:O-antigen/teichoic acid export membrane protein